MSDRIAAENLRALMESWSGEPPYAWKVAINHPDGQRRLGLQQFVAAPLRQQIGIASGGLLDTAADRRVFVEAEVAVRVARDLDRPPSDAERASCIEAVAPCLELVDYSLPGETLRELLEHSFFHAGIVLGPFLAAAQFPALRAPFPRACSEQGKSRARVEGVVDEDLGQVVAAVAALACEAGAPLRRGQLVLCGSYIQPLGLRTGTSVEVDYGPELPKLSVHRA